MQFDHGSPVCAEFDEFVPVSDNKGPDKGLRCSQMAQISRCTSHRVTPCDLSSNVRKRTFGTHIQQRFRSACAFKQCDRNIYWVHFFFFFFFFFDIYLYLVFKLLQYDADTEICDDEVAQILEKKVKDETCLCHKYGMLTLFPFLSGVVGCG